MNLFTRVLSALIFALVFTGTGLNGQNSSWSLYKDFGKYKIEQKTVQCTFQNPEIVMEYVFLKVTNKTSSVLNLKLRLDSYFDGACATCTNDEYVFNFTVPANSSIEPSCGFKTDNDRLTIFIKNINRANYANFDKFEITEIAAQ